MSENMLSGIPITVGYTGSPNRYLTATRVNALVPTDQAKTPDWSMGNRFPTAAQKPYFDMNAFAYAESYTIGSLGARALQAPGLYWMQFYATKSWVFKERAKLSVRLDGHNLPWKRPNLAAPEHDLQPEQSRRVRPLYRHGGRLLELRHRPGQRSGGHARGVLGLHHHRSKRE